MVRILYLGFFEIVLCAMINLSSGSSSSNQTGQIVSLVTVVLGVISIIAVASLLLYNGPYVKGTYAEGSVLNSLWEMRPLHPSRLSDDSEDDSEEEESADAKTKGIFDDALVSKGGEATQTMQSSSVPLN